MKETNLTLPQQVCDYLEAHRYMRLHGDESLSIAYYHYDGTGLVAYDNEVFFTKYSDGDGDRGPEMVEYGSYRGTLSLDFFGWVLLFNIAGIVSFKAFFKNVENEGIDIKKELSKLFDSMSYSAP
jgi:hypothetical protein